MAKILSVKVRVDVNEIETSLDARGKEIRNVKGLYNQTFRSDEEKAFDLEALELVLIKAVPELTKGVEEHLRVRADKARRALEAAEAPGRP